MLTLFYTDKIDTNLSLGQVLNFFTGIEYPPPMGFDNPVSVYFHPTSDFLMASTCALQLTLQTKFYDDEQKFKEKMMYGFLNHGGDLACISCWIETFQYQ